MVGLNPFDTTNSKRLGSGALRHREHGALLAEPLCAALRGSGRLPLRLSLVERHAPTPLLTELELELIHPHMAQKPVLRGEVGCACVAREVN